MSKLISETLSRHGLKILPIILMRLDEEDAELLKTYVLSETDINIYHKAQIDALSVDEVRKLKDFENNNTDVLISVHTSCQIFDLKQEMKLYTKQQGDHASNKVFTLAYTLIISALLYIFLLTWLPIAPDNVRFADTSLGLIGTGVFATVIGYYFTSSARTSSRRSDDPKPKKKTETKNDDTNSEC